MPLTCPAGHQSQTADYCDVCGAAIDPAAAAAPAAPGPGAPAPPASGPTPAAPGPGAPAPPASGPTPAAPDPGPPPAAGTSAGASPVPAPVTGDRCPDCGTARGPDDAFCEVCGLDFATGARPAPPPPPAPAPAADPAAPPGPAAPAGAPSGWTAVVEIDPEFFATNQPDDASRTFTLPTGQPREIPLTGDEVLIGRSGGRPGGPAINLGEDPEDPGVSHRHARLVRRGEGWAVVDVGSTNGTRLGGRPDPLTPDTETPLADGDHLLLGVWTRITLRGPAPATAP